jgi:hypothetical protein
MPYSFTDFVSMFPLVAAPVTLGEETHHAFSTENEPFPGAMIAQFLPILDPPAAAASVETDEDSDFTEYVPCFSLEGTQPYITLVWWKAELLNYEYTLATFTEKGESVSRMVIAYTRLRNQSIVRAVATITEDHGIIIAEGAADGAADYLDASTLQTRNLDLLPDGTIG